MFALYWSFKKQTKVFTNPNLGFKYTAFSAQRYGPDLKSLSILDFKLEKIKNAQGSEKLDGIALWSFPESEANNNN